MFIDASTHYAKEKNQNILKDEHIDKILSAYQNRISENKYSYVAPMSDLRENEYNLNIPRYVNTFDEDESVNLDEISNELKSLESEISKTDNKIADFCDELDIKPPF